MSSVLALDLDGVVNEFCPSSGGIPVARWSKPECVEQLNRVVAEADCDVVIASTWRHYVYQGYMNLQGFRVLMMAIGFWDSVRIVGFTPDGPLFHRGRQIREWWGANPRYDRLVAIDDMELGHAEWGINLVQTDGRVGLTAEDADRAIALLRGDQDR